MASTHEREDTLHLLDSDTTPCGVGTFWPTISHIINYLPNKLKFAAPAYDEPEPDRRNQSKSSKQNVEDKHVEQHG